MGVARVYLFYRCFTDVLHVFYVIVLNLYTNGAKMAAIEGVMALVTGVATAHAASAAPQNHPLARWHANRWRVSLASCVAKNGPNGKQRS
jgi:hypothetical protein